MSRFCIFTSLCLACSLTFAAEPVAAPPVVSPHWISTSTPDVPSIDLIQSFSAQAPMQQATLKFAADFCFATVAINETEVLEVAPFVQLQTLDVTNAVQRGENQLRVRMQEVNRLSGVALTLEVRYVDGTSVTFASDSSWSARTAEEQKGEKSLQIEAENIKLEDRGAVAPELWGIGRRDISISAYENYEQWQQSKGEVADKNRPKFWLAPGFEITEVRVAQPDEGSWIAMAFDDQGRLTVSREDVGLLRMTLAEDKKSVSQVEHIDVKLEECRGLAFLPWSMFANANNSKTFYRGHLTDTGLENDLHPIRMFPGGVGHGRNDIALHDRFVYSIHGDSVDIPAADFLDRTSPLRESKLLPAKKEGTLWRVNQYDSPQWELLHAGLRNPYGVAVDERSQPFTFDADNEHDMGTPWYRPTRILHLITGGDSGYREVTGQLPPRFHDQPDHAPPLLDMGRSSPTSVMFGSQLKFPNPYRKALFALDWTYGRVLAVHLFSRGLSYRAAAETFLQGRPLNVTDIATGPDGAMYLITGGRKTQSALYRVHAVDQESRAWTTRLTAHEKTCDQTVAMSEPQYDEASVFALDDTPFDRMADPIRRHQDRTELERAFAPHEVDRPRVPRIRDWQQTLRPLDYWLVQARRRDQAMVEPTILNELLSTPVASAALTDQFLWVRIANLCWETSRDGVLARRERLIHEVVATWKALDARPYSVAPEGTSVELRRRLAYLLGELGADELPKLAGEKLLASGVQEDQLAGLLALRNQKTGWTIELRKQQFATINSIPLMIGGAGLPPLEKWLREESIKTLTDEEKSALGDLLQPQLTTPESLPPPRPLVQKWTLDALTALHTADGPQGDPERGRVLFREALCARCHRVGLRGAAVGPDLTHVSRRFSRKDVLESVLTPSLSVAENYRLETITTLSGQVHTGRIIPEGDYRSEKIRLALDPLDASKVVEIDKKEIDQHQPSPASPMPSGLLDTLTLEEVRDLLAFLESGGAGRR